MGGGGSHGAGKEPFPTGCGLSAFAPPPLTGIPLVSHWCLRRPISHHGVCGPSLKPTEGPHVIRRGQPGKGGGHEAWCP